MSTSISISNLDGCRCVVLGAGGFIGTNLVRTLVRHGAEVRGFGHPPRFPEAVRGVPWIEGSFHDASAISKALEGREFVYHLLGGSVPGTSNEHIRTELLATAAANLTLLEQCKERQIRRVIFASSGGTVYGATGGSLNVETMLPAPISAYGLGKLMAEGFQSLYERVFGVQQIALRIANPYGPYQTAVHSQGLVAAALSRAICGKALEVWGSGDVVRDYVYIDDVCDAFVRATHYRGEERVFNVGSGVGRSVNSVLTDIGHLFEQQSVQRLYRPGRPADVPISVLCVDKIMREMDWRTSVSWNEGLQRTLAWMRDLSTQI